ncbi:MAG: GAF domain-containing protein [Candidatus Izemoplasmatales bacterium]|jgi:GAF domain-containing protein|nr:GAF domain-containing protein [Candidatus Izemoplasmatales bacterium]MDD4988540.1 GAF domain-containing protein [Candidatus Izemoplasmatales bacterium]MDD5602436.1 GAF domain-containing protein [Candidatus Izemoplasmatales bacterium]MDY0373693.1 GAF domain-containing protein [Candidatus Izemoplasmatales bacterium]
MNAQFDIPFSRRERDPLFLEYLKGYLDKELPLITNLANMAALIKTFYPELNWAGFYLSDGKKLTLGPFQGLPACTSIAFGTGVCGQAAKARQTLLVDDTAQFPGHITCDHLSQSELVVPIVVKNRLVGVLDLDSPVKNHFEKRDQDLFEQAVTLFIDIL